MQVVVGILKNLNNEILIAQRPPGKSQAGAWEFPGGKIEPHETPLQALIREFQEEVGVQVLSAVPWEQFHYTYSGPTVWLDCWIIKEFIGTPEGKENQMISWASFNHLDQFEFLAGNAMIIEKLRVYYHLESGQD